MTLTQHDRDMIHRASQRGQVIVDRNDRRALVTLVAWRPVRNGSRTKTARVQYPAGTFASVPCADVTIP